MSKFHGSLSRRDFMKGLGLATAGVGVATLASPVFHDLDELASSAAPSTRVYNDWFIKEQDFEKITTEMDWTVFQALDKTANPSHTPTADVTAAINAKNAKDQTDGLSGKLPGNSLRDFALSTARGANQGTNPNVWNGATGFKATDPNTPAWNGTPEDNLQMVRAAFHDFGSPTVGVLPVNEHMKRLFDKGAVSWEDIATASLDSKNVYHVPNKCQWVIVWETQMPHVQGSFGYRVDSSTPSGYGTSLQLGRMAGSGYAYANYVYNAATSFIKGLGYQTIKGGVTANVPLGLFAGLSENARNGHRMSPRWGLSTRYANYAVTDLPLAPTKPINFGGHLFCQTCKRCGEVCPSQSISMDTMPSWDTKVKMNRPGHKSFWMSWDSCIDFGAPGNCGICQPTCPFNHPSNGMIHDVVRTTAATTTIFDGFFAKMDRTFGYSKPRSADEIDAYWTRDLSKWEGDTILGAGTLKW